MAKDNKTITLWELPEINTMNDRLSKTEGTGNTTVSYTQAAALSEPAGGEKQSAAFGKLKPAVKMQYPLPGCLALQISPQSEAAR